MNKFKIIIIICMFISIISISKVYAIINSYSLLGKTIYIDPGHGGKDSGTTYKNILEKDINLIMSKKIEKYLGYIMLVIMQRIIGLYIQTKVYF